MKKSLLISLMFIGGILGLIGFSMAAFIDQETQVASLTAGTLDLEPGEESELTCELTAGSGGSDTCDFTFVNVGSVTGSLWAYGYIQPYACNDATYGANDETEYCDGSADISYDSVLYCGTFGTWVETCPATNDLLEFSEDGYCVNVDTAIAPDEEIDGSFTFTFGTLTNVQQGDAMVIRWNLYFTDSTSTTPPTECTTFFPPPVI